MIQQNTRYSLAFVLSWLASVLGFSQAQTPRTRLRLYCTCLVYVWGLLVGMRLLFALLIHRQLPGLFSADVWHGLYIGCKFDARLAALFTLPLGVCFALPFLARRITARRVSAVYAVFFLALCTIYAFDLGFYYYLGVRLDATLWELLQDFSDGVQMVWQSYPVVWISLGVTLSALLATLGLGKIAGQPQAEQKGWLATLGGLVAGLLLCTLMVYGQISSNFFPLRWSHAYFTPNQYVVALALNPVQNFVDTLHSAAAEQYNIAEVRKVYPLVASYLGVDRPDVSSLGYDRAVPATGQPPMNVVIIIMESLAYPKTSLAPGGANPTPHLQELAKTSRVYHRFFANARTTARAVFTVLTGIPDVNASGTGSRNPFITSQHLILNDFAGYKKYYMIGGNASWANIRGILRHNVDDLALLEERSWRSPNVDVWGISDHALLQEAHEVLEKHTQDEPFVAVIQTAGYHRPYTIPPTPGFALAELDEERLALYGFENQQEYNSLRYADFALGEFMAKARQSAYYDNTVFFVFGDHGIKDSGNNMPAGYYAADVAPWHVPLLIHTSPRAARAVQPDNIYHSASHVDVFPTAAGMAGIAYTNRTMGRDLFDARFAAERSSYIGGRRDAALRLVAGDYCYYDNRGSVSHLYRLDDTSSEDCSREKPDVFAPMQQLGRALDVTASYMLYHNKRQHSQPSRDQRGQAAATRP